MYIFIKNLMEICTFNKESFKYEYLATNHGKIESFKIVLLIVLYK